jgi:hypothetical protein
MEENIHRPNQVGPYLYFLDFIIRINADQETLVKHDRCRHHHETWTSSFIITIITFQNNVCY